MESMKKCFQQKLIVTILEST